MSSIHQMTSTSDLLETTSTHQDLFMDLNEEDAETISGGYEVFTIKNNTIYTLGYYIDGTYFSSRPDQSRTFTAYNGGIITFDKDVRAGYTQNQTYNLANGKVYAFKNDGSTPGNPYDVNLYSA